MTVEAIQKHLPHVNAKIKGHLNKTRKNLRTTRPKPIDQKINEDMRPSENSNAACEMFCFVALADTNKGKIYSDVTGKFLVQSYHGHR